MTALLHKLMRATLIGAVVASAPAAGFAQKIPPRSHPYSADEMHQPAAPYSTPAAPAYEGSSQPDWLNTWPAMREDGANPAADANSVSPVFEGPRPSSAH
jgi:hypothetical protein